jgi:uncharacterized membrane protein YfcA
MLAIFLGIGLAAGVLSGLFGLGGGVLIVPSLVYLANFPTRMAFGTSLGALLLPVGLLGAYAYWDNGDLDVRASLLIAVGLFLGAYAGARLSQVIPPATLQRVFALFIGAVALQLWFKAGSP